MNKRILGVLTLSEEILCKKEVLGKTFNARIADINVDLHFPFYPSVTNNLSEEAMVGSNYCLVPPALGPKWKRGDEDLYWGRSILQPSGESCVKLLALSFECENAHINSYAEKIYNSITKWEHSFIDYLKLETKQSIHRDKNITRNPCGLELIADKYIPKHVEMTLFGYLHTTEKFASYENIFNAITFADSTKEFQPEYQMLLSSYKARRFDQNRPAIIDACSALEICLVNYIKTRCQELNLDSDLFLKIKFRSLGDRISLAQALDPNFPAGDYETKVVKPRNDIAHNREIYPSDSVTDELILCVEKCLTHYSDGKYY